MSDAQLLTADGKFHLLAREGDKYLDKPIEPKSDWLTYHGSISGNRYSDARSNQHRQRAETVRGLEISLFPIRHGLQATPVVVDGDYVHDGVE